MEKIVSTSRWLEILVLNLMIIQLIKMIRDIGTKFDDYSISQKIRQIILHWVCELTEEGFF